MTMRQKRSLAGVSSVAAVALLVSLASVLVAQSHGVDQRIELVAVCMSFRSVESSAARDAEDNPTLRLRAGQRVELVLRGDDPGMKHDLAIPELGLKSSPVAQGETAVIRFTAPPAGTYGYLCSMHPQIMRGVMIVEP